MPDQDGPPMTVPPTPPMQSAREEAERRWPNDTVYRGVLHDGELAGLSRAAFIAGAEWKRTQVEKLLEAVDALVDEHDEPWTKALVSLLAEMRALSGASESS